MSSISTILLQVTEELRKVAERLEGVQGAVGELAIGGSSPRSAQFRQLQDLDRATQEVAALGAFLEALSADCPPEWRADPKRASLAVNLHDLAAALAQDGSAERQPAADEHEYEIFD
ncbi:MAG: hypothetical protein JO107_10455 [Hyphomicrobiales bacterium]|nr:hypothetical protein [Hyphomicrobiales bacterium]MBV8663511.1 hypothetical protein [Hyphomicrobiales bacterium]